MTALTTEVLRAGSWATRQRRALRRRGLLTDVVDLLIDATAGRCAPVTAPHSPDRSWTTPVPGRHTGEFALVNTADETTGPAGGTTAGPGKDGGEHVRNLR